MPIPALTADGYLPAGEHLCNLAEVQAVFANNEHRQNLVDNFHRFLDWMHQTHDLVFPYYVDGSFTTAKQLPSDIDFVIDLTGAPTDKVRRALDLWSMGRATIKENFKVDFWPYFPGANNDLRAYFQYVRIEELQERQLPMDTRKGILRVVP